MSDRRRFNQGEKNALYLANNGRCAICGEALSSGWHADHKTAFSRGGATDVANGQALIKRVISEDRWRCRYVRVLSHEVEFPSFVAFLSAAVPEGLGADLATIKRLCGDDPEALDLIDRVTAGRQGERTDLVDNINEVSQDERPTGTSSQSAIRRLRKDRPDLHEQVLQRQKSPHAAMVEAGFRPRTMTVPMEPIAMARSIRRRLNDEEIDILIDTLGEAE